MVLANALFLVVRAFHCVVIAALITRPSCGNFLLRFVLAWLRHFTPKLHFTKNSAYGGVIGLPVPNISIFVSLSRLTY